MIKHVKYERILKLYLCVYVSILKIYGQRKMRLTHLISTSSYFLSFQTYQYLSNSEYLIFIYFAIWTLSLICFLPIFPCFPNTLNYLSFCTEHIWWATSNSLRNQVIYMPISSDLSLLRALMYLMLPSSLRPCWVDEPHSLASPLIGSFLSIYKI